MEAGSEELNNSQKRKWIGNIPSHNHYSGHFQSSHCLQQFHSRSWWHSNMVVKKSCSYCQSRGRHSTAQGRCHKFLTGGTDPDWGGTDLGESKPPSPKFQFLLGFRPLCFENIRKSKSFRKNFKKIFKNCYLWGGISQNFEPGGHLPASPTATAHAQPFGLCQE